MEILLIENLISLGSRGDIVNVKPGYARNFLLPNKIGIPVTAGNKRQIELEKEKAQKFERLRFSTPSKLRASFLISKSLFRRRWAKMATYLEV